MKVEILVYLREGAGHVHQGMKETKEDGYASYWAGVRAGSGTRQVQRRER
jgi:hypothetical protein